MAEVTSLLFLLQHIHQEITRLFALRKSFWETLQAVFSQTVEGSGVDVCSTPPPPKKPKGRPTKASCGQPRIVRGLKADTCHPGCGIHFIAVTRYIVTSIHQYAWWFHWIQCGEKRFVKLTFSCEEIIDLYGGSTPQDSIAISYLELKIIKLNI